MQIENKKECCGCGACMQICPAECIKMEEDGEGFLYPATVKDQCAGCGLCEKVCPMTNAERKSAADKLSVYAAYIPDENIRMKSSSGGVFSALSEIVLYSGGFVFGAAFDESFLVHHIAADNNEALNKLRGSKYLQSRTEETYREAKTALEHGILVLYSGTGCQIAGLKGYLQNDYENLLTVDVVCHGVPSPKLWEKYLEWQENIHAAAVRQIFFRKKNNYGWKKYALSLAFSNGETYERIFKEDPFMQMFLGNICLRPSCYNCKYKAVNSQADLTLGDAWGIGKYMSEMDDDKGCSLILVHTEKGKLFLEKLSDKLVCKEALPEEIRQPMVYSSAPEHPRRERFFRELEIGSDIEKLTELTRPTTCEKIAKKLKKISSRFQFSGNP